MSVLLEQGFLTGGKFPPWGKYWEFRGGGGNESV